MVASPKHIIRVLTVPLKVALEHHITYYEYVLQVLKWIVTKTLYPGTKGVTTSQLNTSGVERAGPVKSKACFTGLITENQTSLPISLPTFSKRARGIENLK